MELTIPSGGYMASLKKAVEKLTTPTALSLVIGAAGLFITAGVALGVFFYAKQPDLLQNPPEPDNKAQTDHYEEPTFIG